MNHLTDQILDNAVANLPDSFDDHCLIQALMTKNPREYVRELHENVASDDPIRTTHAAIGRALHRLPGIEPTQRVYSSNVRGRQTANQEWRKLVQPKDDAPTAEG